VILRLNPFRPHDGRGVAPGVRRLVLPEREPRMLANPGGVPLTLTLREGRERHGMMAPSGRTPWGCLFFIIFGASLTVAVFSRNGAVLVALTSLILLWGFYNHPRRQAAEPCMTALGRIGQGHGGEAVRETSRALDLYSEHDGVHYLAALARITAGQWEAALEHLELAAPSFRDYAEFHHALGMARKALGRSDLATEAIRRALEYPDYPLRDLLEKELQ